MRKIDQIKQLIILNAVIACVIVAQLPVNSQTSRVGTRPPATSPIKPVGTQQARRPLNDKIREVLKAFRPEKGRAMADAFRKGKLPEPARLPQGNIDQQAAALAKAVSAGDESSTAALYAAILAAGYGVRDTEGSVLQTTERGQGLVLPASDVAATAKMYGEDYGVMLSHLSEAFVRNIPELKDIPLATVILDVIRASANSNHPAVRFWGRFIVELGRNARVPNDLLGTVDSKKTRMDAIQVSLLLSRLAADLGSLDKRTAQARRTNYSHARPKHAINGTNGPVQSRCNPDAVQDLILDYNALVSTTLFGELAERLGQISKVMGKLIGFANTIAAVLKFISSYALLKVEISMDAEYLVRTADTQPGTFQTLSAKVEIDNAPWQELKCWRPVLNYYGLDIEIPENGPVKDVALDWMLVAGGNPTPILQQIEDAIHPDAYPDAIVFLRAEVGVENRRPDRQRTDSNGVSRIEVWGIPQQEDLSKKKPIEVWKVAGVTVGVQLKPMKIRDAKGALSTLNDLAGNVISFLTKDWIGGVLGVGFESAYRSQWYSAEPFFFPVQDWEPCTGHWQGTITYSTTLKEKGSIQSVTNNSAWDDEQYYEASAEISGKRTSDGAPWAIVKASATKITRRYSSGRGVCYQESSQIQELRGKETVQTTGFSVTVDPRTRRYDVSPPLPVVDGSGTYLVKAEKKGTCNNAFNPGISPKPVPVTGIKLADDGPDLHGVGYIDPNNPNTISGTRTEKLPTQRGDERITTITWNLTRCPN
jgi:hypothetical protein